MNSPRIAYSTNPETIHLDLTVAELQNLQAFHAQRQSRSDDGCREAELGFKVERKLTSALADVGVTSVSSEDLATRY